MADVIYDVIIIGCGVSGFAAAIYSARFKLNTLIVGKVSGGTINNAKEVENYPGFKSISGIDLGDRIRDHATSYDITLKETEVISVEKNKGGFTVRTKKEDFSGRCLIFATGTAHRKLKIPGEERFHGNGVHACALCDGITYKGRTVAIIGGSDSAAREALILSEHARKVYIIYRGNDIRAEPINKKRVEDNQKIEIIRNTNITEIMGKGRVVESVMLDKEYKGSKVIALDGVFVNIGHVPLTSLTHSLGVKLNEKKEIMTDTEGKTNVAGVFAAGDCTGFFWKQAITGVAQGCTAAYSAYNFLKR
ncbi:FAD-dependent oxidoreductase [Candidatus Woesearchaeota archaeon]|nr:FAD-dependent oxidoreductase [Candidatus Woesearchaeota archaeon]